VIVDLGRKKIGLIGVLVDVCSIFVVCVCGGGFSVNNSQLFCDQLLTNRDCVVVCVFKSLTEN
jgi:hypothetical protein